MYLEINKNCNEELINELKKISVEERHAFVPSMYFKNRKKVNYYLTITNNNIVKLLQLSSIRQEFINNIKILCYNNINNKNQYIATFGITDIQGVTTTFIINDNYSIKSHIQCKNFIIFDKETGSFKQELAERIGDEYIAHVRPVEKYTYKDIIPLTLTEQTDLSNIIHYRLKSTIRRCEGILWCQKYDEIQQKLNSLYNRIHNTAVYWTKVTTNNINVNTDTESGFWINLNSVNNFIVDQSGLLFAGNIC